MTKFEIALLIYIAVLEWRLWMMRTMSSILNKTIDELYRLIKLRGYDK